MKLIHLKDISYHLSSTYVKIDLNFLKKLIYDAAKEDDPLRSEKFAKKLGLKYNTKINKCLSLYNWIKGLRFIPFSKLFLLENISSYSWLDIEQNIICIKSGRNKGEIYPNFPIKLDNRLGSIVGHLLGDGSIDKKYRQVFFANSSKELLLEFEYFMKDIFHINGRFWMQTRNGFSKKNKWIKREDINNFNPKFSGGLFYPSICGDFLHSIFGKFALGKDKKITCEIRKTSLEFKIALVKAFFDDESSVYVNSRCIRVFQDRKEMLEDMRLFLEEINIKTNPVRSYIKRDKERYYFNITHISNYFRFYNLIGFTSSEKMNKLKTLINNVKNSHKYKNLILN